MDKIAVCEIRTRDRRASFATANPQRAHTEGRRVADALGFPSRWGHSLFVTCFEFVKVECPVTRQDYMTPKRIRRYGAS